ncbi:hypothetical protein [Beijerinckia sp. L45]|uniref:hypothetical protein n=1 Tax=Beijerinckia sp. L45 TaxID=1641855 RepID=UPI00131B45DA|nr:hypothetical protein [Beijerinckia sp. L45]
MSIPIDGASHQADTAPETSEQKSTRIARERVLIEEGLEDVRQGRIIRWEDLEPWLEVLDKDSEAPIPLRAGISSGNP